MPDPLCAFVGQGAALTAAAWAAAAANADGGGPFQRLGEGRGAALREAWTAEAVRTVPAERRAAAGDADELFAYARPPTKRERLEKGERRAEQHQGWADAPKEKRRRAAEEQTAAQAALLGPLAAADTTASSINQAVCRSRFGGVLGVYLKVVKRVLHWTRSSPGWRRL